MPAGPLGSIPGTDNESNEKALLLSSKWEEVEGWAVSNAAVALVS